MGSAAQGIGEWSHLGSARAGRGNGITWGAVCKGGGGGNGIGWGVLESAGEGGGRAIESEGGLYKGGGGF